MEILKKYQNDAALRRSFNALAERTFGLNFENWYQMGFWGDHYTPYSLVLDGEVVANVSVNRTDMLIRGERKRLYQLGTVMTAENHRNRGYIRTLMTEIEKDIRDAEGIYLFANDSVVEFYPKFGFVPGVEHVCTKQVDQEGPCRMMPVPMDNDGARSRLSRAMEENAFPTGCHMVGNSGLIFFYAAQFMSGCVCYCEDLDAWAIAELDAGELMLHNVFCPREIPLADVIAAFGSEVRRVTLGFTPADTTGWDCREWKEEDCHFFVKGPAFEDFAGKKLRILSLSHA